MRLSLGTMQIGGELSEIESVRLLNHYFSRGNYKFDTAQMYPVPASKKKFALTEKILGNWLNSLNKNDKEKIEISTKFPNYSKKLNYLRKNNDLVISHKELKESLLSSLERLNLNNVETFFIHWPSREINNFGKSFYQSKGDEKTICSSLEETYSNLFLLAKEGLCGSVGISNESPIGLHCLSKVAAYNKQVPLYIQNSYNLLNPTVDINITEFCMATNIKLQAHSPLAFGVLSGKYRDNSLPKNSRRFLYPNYFDRYQNIRSKKLVDNLSKLCESFNLNLIELSYRYLLNNPAVSEIIIGAKNIPQIDFAIESLAKGKLPNNIYDEVFRLLSEYSISAW
tara:strand:+ start:162 stop:1181 length:1020 start_codon:yes stop_codon:yes gene_type:complete